MGGGGGINMRWEGRPRRQTGGRCFWWVQSCEGDSRECREKSANRGDASCTAFLFGGVADALQIRVDVECYKKLFEESYLALHWC